MEKKAAEVKIKESTPWVRVAQRAVPYEEKKAAEVKINEDIPKVEPKAFTTSIGMEFVYIPPGTFMMGSPPNEPGRVDNEKQHRVTLTKGFYLQTTEVTQGLWENVMGNDPSYFKECGDDCPVEQVSWHDAQDFISELNKRERLEGTDRYRLPTEAEWEYACRAGTTGKYYFGNDETMLREYAWYAKNSVYETHPVRQRKPNKWGLYDMHGNVWEWCQDWYGDYRSGSVTNPRGPFTGEHRVLRGGSWYGNQELARCAYRSIFGTPTNCYTIIGFRLARTKRR